MKIRCSFIKVMEYKIRLIIMTVELRNKFYRQSRREWSKAYFIRINQQLIFLRLTALFPYRRLLRITFN